MAALISLVFFGVPILIAYLVTSIDTSSNGLFKQIRVGQKAKLFTIYKLKTINPKTKKISTIGNFLRKSKIDELPQLVNILIGQMSFVGPRPDIPGYYDTLEGENRKILKLKPGLTSEASIKYAKEEMILSQQVDPLAYNDYVIFPDKVKMNLKYYYNQSIFLDLQILFRTIFRSFGEGDIWKREDEKAK
ncbi:sugar transferase [Flavobacterium gelidilacus]|uniref:sugar transferase n=1 Tax=Flavobacterium gelidilacus TaxID=206041 RepID=UPI00040CECDB